MFSAHFLATSSFSSLTEMHIGWLTLEYGTNTLLILDWNCSLQHVMLEDPLRLIVYSCVKPAFRLIGYNTFWISNTELTNACVINQWNSLLALLLNYDF